MPLKAIFLTLAFFTPQLNAAPPRRILVISAPTAQDPTYIQQLALLTPRKKDLAERDITLQLLTAPTDAATRHRLHIPKTKFTVLLIGKDDAEKLRQHTLITIETLNQTVDEMPMRQQEVRNKK